jgi:hypothetical protein
MPKNRVLSRPFSGSGNPEIAPAPALAFHPPSCTVTISSTFLGAGKKKGQIK